MADYRLANDGTKLADKLARLAKAAPQDAQRIIVETTMETQEAIIDKITNDIEPHSAMSRKPPVAVATDLVDTGAYRASWVVGFPGPFIGRVSTNIAYALVLEYGSKDGSRPGFYVARDTARKMRPVLAKKADEAIKRILG